MGIKNSGTHASLWNYGKVPGMVANGTGQFVISGAVSAYRKVAASGFATGVKTTGHYQLIIEFSAWNLDSTSKGALGFEVVDKSGKRVVALHFIQTTQLNQKYVYLQHLLQVMRM